MISGIDYIMQLEQEVEKQRRYVKEEKEKKKELQQRIDKAIEYIKITIKIIKEQSTGNDEWILERLNGFLKVLGGEQDGL